MRIVNTTHADAWSSTTRLEISAEDGGVGPGPVPPQNLFPGPDDTPVRADSAGNNNPGNQSGGSTTRSRARAGARRMDLSAAGPSGLNTNDTDDNDNDDREGGSGGSGGSGSNQEDGGDSEAMTEYTLRESSSEGRSMDLGDHEDDSPEETQSSCSMSIIPSSVAMFTLQTSPKPSLSSRLATLKRRAEAEGVRPRSVSESSAVGGGFLTR